MSDELLLKFRDKNTPYGVTRKTVKALSAKLNMTETMVIHLAVSRFAKEVLPAYEADNGPLAPDYLAWLRQTAKAELAQGKVLTRKSLL